MTANIFLNLTWCKYWAWINNQNIKLNIVVQLVPKVSGLVYFYTSLIYVQFMWKNVKGLPKKTNC